MVTLKHHFTFMSTTTDNFSFLSPTTDKQFQLVSTTNNFCFRRVFVFLSKTTDNFSFSRMATDNFIFSRTAADNFSFFEYNNRQFQFFENENSLFQLSATNNFCFRHTATDNFSFRERQQKISVFPRTATDNFSFFFKIVFGNTQFLFSAFCHHIISFFKVKTTGNFSFSRGGGVTPYLGWVQMCRGRNLGKARASSMWQKIGTQRPGKEEKSSEI